MTTTSAALGLFVGLILALTGSGGSILAIPLLVFGLHLTLVQAGPPALLAVALAATLGALLGHRERVLRYKAAGLIASVGLVASPIGLWVAARVPNTPLTLVFATVLGVVAVRMFVQARRDLRGVVADQPRPPPPCRLDPTIGKLRWTLSCARALATCGAAAGFVSGLLGVGGGFVIVPALRRFTDLEMRSIVATSLAVIAVVSTGGVVTAAVAGQVLWSIAIPFAAGAVAGMLAGRAVGRRVRGPRLQQVFAIVTAAIAVTMLTMPLWRAAP